MAFLSHGATRPALSLFSFTFVLNSRSYHDVVLEQNALFCSYTNIFISAPHSPTHSTSACDRFHNHHYVGGQQVLTFFQYAHATNRTEECSRKRRLSASLTTIWPTMLTKVFTNIVYI